MNDTELIKSMAENRVFAVVRAASAEAALRAAEAAVIGGVKLVEVALTTPGGFRVISDLRRRYGDRIFVGAGSVMTYEQIDRAIKGGTQFVSMPHTSVPLVELCRKSRIPVVTGALTPTEAAAAWSLNLPAVKIYPASALGGPDYVGALTSKMVGVRIIAAGGVGPENIVDYFAAGALAIAVGSRLFTRGDLQNENYAAIAERARGIIRLAGVA
jgi:2-dehydro-3-deoxyphosphogluconate aldolase/(4S)-4-hydroxy-2-oxoglutarate aldolase